MTNSFFEYKDFKQVLIDELQRRTKKNPLYSTNAFARDIGLRTDIIRDVLKGRYGISPKVAAQVAGNLQLPEEESQYFCDLVASKHSRSKIDKRLASERLQKRWADDHFESLGDEILPVFEKWYYSAVLELITIRKGKIDADQDAKSLGISKDEFLNSINVLESAGLITKNDGIYVEHFSFKKINRPIPTPIIKNMHTQILDKAKVAVMNQETDRRKSRSTVFSFDSSRIQEAREEIEKFHDAFITKFGTKNIDSVYSATFHLFRLDGETND